MLDCKGKRTTPVFHEAFTFSINISHYFGRWRIRQLDKLAKLCYYVKLYFLFYRR